MPGHVKMGKAGEPDPDPTEYLVVSMDMKREDQMKPYDPRKSYWVPDGKGGFIEAMLEENDGKNAKVVIKGYEVSFAQCSELLIGASNNSFKHHHSIYRKRPTSLMRLARSIHPSLRSAKTWLT